MTGTPARPDHPQVIVVGSFVQDHVWRIDRFVQAGETRRALGFSTGPGGKGFNQVVACARQGIATLFIGAIGEDALGANAQRLARDERVECRWLVRTDRSTATAGIVVDAAGANQIVVHLAANDHLDPSFIEEQGDAFDAAKVLLLQMENNLDATVAALTLATRHRLLRVLNPAPVHPGLDAALLARVDVLTPNETEFAQLLERVIGVATDADTLARQSDEELHRLARTLGVATVVITLGANGSFVSHGEADRRGDAEAFYRVEAEPANTLDTTGAGDAFSGALVAALLRFAGQPFRQAVEHAGRAAALSTEKAGASTAMPHFDDVIARFS
ncbi:MAG: ribokinase [Dokdonella sp.]|uniref:ribokinase n=1 Tax=Dokdonella sp. TaxID=2291710 RepID=UPI0032672BB3